MGKARNSNIELLRIIAMFMIVISHVSEHGFRDVVGGGTLCSFDYFDRTILRCFDLGNIGSVIFVIISGYFLTYSKGVNWSRLRKLYGQVWFYSVFCFVCLGVFLAHSFSIKETFVSLTPVIHNVSWFYSAYILLYLSHPYLNYITETVTRKEFLHLIVGMLVIWSIIQPLCCTNYYLNPFIEFILYYFIGAYLRRNPDNVVMNHAGEFLLGSIVLWISIIMVAELPFVPHVAEIYSYQFGHRISIIVIAVSSSLFCLFSKISLTNKRWINIVSSSVGGIYLLHDNPWFRNAIFASPYKLLQLSHNVVIPSLILYSFAIFTACMIFELIRAKVFSLTSKEHQ